jgi:hypothetical protein
MFESSTVRIEVLAAVITRDGQYLDGHFLPWEERREAVEVCAGRVRADLAYPPADVLVVVAELPVREVQQAGRVDGAHEAVDLRDETGRLGPCVER